MRLLSGLLLLIIILSVLAVLVLALIPPVTLHDALTVPLSSPAATGSGKAPAAGATTGAGAPRPATGRPLPVPSRADRDRLPQRLYTITAYTWTGQRTTSGVWPKAGMCASNLWPLGTVLRVGDLGTYTVTDRSAPGATDVDIYTPSRPAALRFGRQHLPVTVVGAAAVPSEVQR